VELSESKNLLTLYNLGIGLILIAVITTTIEMYAEFVIDQNLLILIIIIAIASATQWIHSLKEF
jgi:hypothetical protein